MTTTENELFENLMHVGHISNKWNPKMKKFLCEKRNNIWAFDLEQTKKALEKTTQFLKAIKIQNKKLLFVGTKPQSSFLIQELVAPTKHFFIDKKWTPGFITNFKEIRNRVNYYLNLKSQFESGDINKYTKKEVSAFKKDLDKLEIAFGGVAEMRQRPDVIVVLDAVTDRLAIDEANNAGIAVIALTDANANPDGIDYIVPGNDDAIKSIRFFLKSVLKSLEK
jgi:small subunit ribosomal protein S2